MAIKRKEQAETGHDLKCYVVREVKARPDISTRQNGTSHFVATDGKTWAIIPDTNKPMGKGLKCALIKALTAMGLILILVMIFVAVV